MPSPYDDLIQAAYATIGRTGMGEGAGQIDPSGYNYWQQQLQSGAINPQDFGATFNQAVQGALAAQPTSAVSQQVQDYMSGTGQAPVISTGGGKARLPEPIDQYGTSPYFPDPYAPVVSKPGPIFDVNQNLPPPDLMYADRGPRDQAFEPTGGAAPMGGPLSMLAQANQVRTATQAPSIDDLIRQAYASIGRTDIDPEGLAYWKGQLTGANALNPQQFTDKFNAAVSGVLANPSEKSSQIAADVVNYLYSNPNAAITMPKVDRLEVLRAFQAIPGANPNPSAADLDYYQKVGIGQLIKDVKAINASNPAQAARIAADRERLTLPNVNVVDNRVRPDLPIRIRFPRTIK